jgi:hypothetical protein
MDRRLDYKLLLTMDFAEDVRRFNRHLLVLISATTHTNGRERRAYGTSTSKAGRQAGLFFCPTWP